MFLQGMCLPAPKRGLKHFLFSCFHTDYDDRLDSLVLTSRESTKSLYKELLQDTIGARIESGLMNTVKLILSNDDDTVSLFHVAKNYRFYLNVMEQAYGENDHQTAMLMYLALTHGSVQRLRFKRPKRSKELLDKVKESYGSVNNCYANHIYEVINTHENDFLPSIIALSMYVDNEYPKAYASMGHNMDDTNVKEAADAANMYAYLYLRNDNVIPLYENEDVTSRDLFELSEVIQRNALGKLKRTKKQSVCWTENPI